MNKSKEKSESKIDLPKHYKSIDNLPILVWERIHKTEDITNLIIDKQEITDEQKEKLNEVWKKIYNEYIEVFGFSEQFKNVYEQKTKIARLKVKKIISGDLSIENFIRIEQIKLNNMEKRIEIAPDIYDTKIIIEKKLGIRIPLNEVTVREFFSYMKDLNKK